MPAAAPAAAKRAGKRSTPQKGKAASPRKQGKENASPNNKQIPSGPRPVMIIQIEDDGNQFVLMEDALKEVLMKIPENMKISVVSVVGAFRTGKSFLLDMFLRYLRETRNTPFSSLQLDGEPDQSWLDTTKALEGNKNLGPGDEGGFGWRSGKERCTTGIWLWSEHFVRELPPTKPGVPGEKVAVLLLDTQGMFDQTLGQMLTASIFGLSTLISSYQVYNLDKRVQEDHLQHLALFTEYGRVALVEERKRGKDGKAPAEAKQTDDLWYSDSQGDGETTGSGLRPFQRIEFLVRDWQNFTHEDGGSLEDMQEDMRVYLKEILDEREQKDLKQVRDQIHDCFETVSCFLLPHPGIEVTSRSYDGDVKKIRPEFRRLLSEYVRRVFSSRLVPKKIHGRSVTRLELFVFIKAYCALFREAKIFPEAKTLLAATSEANNRAALDVALKKYRAEMDAMAGPGRVYCAEGKLREHDKVCREAAIEKFDSMATLGPKSDIEVFRKELRETLVTRFKEYEEANRLRDPFAFVGPYIVPLLVALAAYMIRWVMDIFCTSWSVYCATGADFLTNVYMIVFSFLLFHLAATGHGVRKRVALIFGMVSEGMKEL